MELAKSKTFINLAKSFAGECQARTRYEFMEYGARTAGYKCLAEMIDNVAYNEFNHARMFYTFMQKAGKKALENVDICTGYPFKEKWDLADNLKFAAEDEANEAERIYPEYAKIAREEGFEEIAALYENIIQVETCHRKLFEQLHEQLVSGTMYKREQPIKWKCASCGYESTQKEAWDICPICGEKQGAVMLNLEQ